MRLYHSTRDESRKAGADEAILQGLSPDGGLYVPESFPVLDLKALLPLSAHVLFARVLSALLDDYSLEEMLAIVRAGYAGRFSDEVTPLAAAGDMYMLELFRGPTSAFKDVALSLLPRLIARAAGKLGVTDEIRILTATSGDTGKAALAGFAGVKGTSIVVFYPLGGVSEVQRLQMVTQPGENVRVCAVVGNFDDAQTGVKRIFADAALNARLAARGVRLSSANSINLGRLAPQIAYYFKAYLDLVRRGAIQIGDKINFSVPTGNFGDILAGDYARRMGLPVGKLICASNKNNVLADFIRTGVYDRRRAFHKTASPSMDILISSNLERCLYHMSGDAALVRKMMADLSEKGIFEAPASLMENMRAVFAAGWAGDAAAFAAIRETYEKTGYLMDTHTAVGRRVAEEFARESGDERPMVVLATASPFKFAEDVLKAVAGEERTGFRALDRLSKVCGLPVPGPLAALIDQKEIHADVVGAEGMARYVEEA
jgi:threonine synthase